MVRLLKKAVPNHDGDLRTKFERGVQRIVVEYLLHERSNEHVLVHDIKRRERLSPRQDVLADAAGETLLHAAGLGQHAGKYLATVWIMWAGSGLAIALICLVCAVDRTAHGAVGARRVRRP
jgi:hypothetical protein